jgi:hypothetical protein
MEICSTIIQGSDFYFNFPGIYSVESKIYNKIYHKEWSIEVNKISESGLNIKVFPDEYFSCKKITPAALTSLTIGLKGYFSTYNTLHSFNYNLNTLTETQEKQLCEFSEYHENYMQSIIHFHHFLELIMKDVLRSNNENLANKLKGNNVKETCLLERINEGSSLDEISFTNKSVEFNVSVKRICALSHNSVKDIVVQHMDTITEINLLRNKLLHRGSYFLTYMQLDDFIVKKILPLVHELLYKSGLWDGEELEEYWRYDNDYADIDPITELLNKSEEKNINYKAVAFYKAIGLAMYQKPKGSILKRIYEEDLIKQIYDFRSNSNKTCFVCGFKTLFLYPDIDFTSPLKFTKGEHLFESGKAICTNCGLKLYNDIKEPTEYGINEDEGLIWGYTHLIEIN